MVHRLAPAALLIFLMGSITLGAPQGEFRIAGQKGAEGWAALGEQANGDLLVDRVVSGTRLRGVLRASNGTWSGRLVRSGGASGALAASGSAHTFDLILTPRQGSDRDLDADWVERQSPTQILRGRARWQRVSESSTLGSSPLMASVTRNALRTASKGNVPRELMLTKAGNQVDPQLLIEGPQIFARAAAMIEAAEEEVLIQTFHWAPSKAADTIMAGLKALEVRRRAAGATTPVRVRFVVDRNRILKALRHTERDLKANLRATGLDSRFVQVEVESHTHWLYGALHSKLFVIDGRHAMITGANVNDWAEAPKTWYELGLVVHGPVVEGLRAEFAQLWNKKHKSPLAALQTAPLPASGPGVPVLITSRKSRGNVFQDNDDNPASQSYFALLRSAQSHVRILTPHLNDDDVRRELIACLRRGVRVELVLSKGFGLARAKLPFQGGNNTKNLGRLYRRLKNHPAALARFQVRWFSRDGQSPISTEENNSHAKYMTCDDRVAIIGCSNLDEQSFNHSREVNLVIEDATLTQGFDQQAFLPVYSRSIPVDLSALK